MYYGWIVVAVTGLTIVVASGMRAAPGALINPLEDSQGWSRSSISFGIAIGWLVFAFTAPATGALVERFGPRRMMLAGVTLTGASVAASAAMATLWQFTVLWGVTTGIGTGLLALVLGATVANRWFDTRRGLVMGIFGASSSLGQLLFVPLTIGLVDLLDWRGAMLGLAACMAAVILPLLLFMRDSPASMGLRPLGAADTPADPRMAAAASGERVMGRVIRVPEFWLLAGSFWICGATTTGLIGTHLIPHATDKGMSEGLAALALAIMGATNFAGTIASGWLTDRYDPRRLLAVYYSFRGFSLFLLPFIGEAYGLTAFAIVFGLDYIATVPPTVALTADIFGRRNVGVVFGWVFCAHMVGAAMATWGAGLAFDALGAYTLAFLGGGAISLVAGGLALGINRERRLAGELAPAAA
jgi:MFS family permease